LQTETTFGDIWITLLGLATCSKLVLATVRYYCIIC